MAKKPLVDLAMTPLDKRNESDHNRPRRQRNPMLGASRLVKGITTFFPPGRTFPL